MGLWSVVGKAALSFTRAVGDAVLTTGGEAIKGGTKIYDDYQKGKKADLAKRIAETTCSALGAGIIAGVKDMSQSASDIYADYQKEQIEEAKRRAEEKERERQEYERQKGRQEQSKLRFHSNLPEDSTNHTVIFSKIRGVTWDGRQELIKNLVCGESLGAVREPSNAYDKNAVAIYSVDGQIGYLSKDLAKTISPILERKADVRITVSEVTGQDKEIQGVNIKIQVEKEYLTAQSQTSQSSFTYRNNEKEETPEKVQHSGLVSKSAQNDTKQSQIKRQLVHPWVGNHLHPPDYSFIIEMDTTTLNTMTIRKKFIDGSKFIQNNNHYYDIALLLCYIDRTEIKLFMKEYDKLTEIGRIPDKATHFFLPIINAGGTMSVWLHAFLDFDNRQMDIEQFFRFGPELEKYYDLFSEPCIPYEKKRKYSNKFKYDVDSDDAYFVQNQIEEYAGWIGEWDYHKELKKVDKILLRVHIGINKCLDTIDTYLVNDMNKQLYAVEYIKNTIYYDPDIDYINKTHHDLDDDEYDCDEDYGYDYDD